MRYLFFFVHPAKFHLFRNTINALLKDGHTVDIAITTKDVLEKLVISEGWTYTNIFREGRKIKWLPTLVGAGINFFRTIYRLLRFVGWKRYDLFVTDDILVVVGRMKAVPTVFFIDNEPATVPEISILLWLAQNILAPTSVNLGRYESKKIRFTGYKELAYLHPKYFLPSNRIVEEFHKDPGPYVLIRLVAFAATHDKNKKGISDEQLGQLIELFERFGRVYISSERMLLSQFEKYRLSTRPEQIAHILATANLFVSDSATMSSEAAVLGVPTFFVSDFVGMLNCVDEKDYKYGLLLGYKPARFDSMLAKVNELLSSDSLKADWHSKREFMLKETIDLTAFMIWLFSDFAKNIAIIRANSEYELNFRGAAAIIEDDDKQRRASGKE